MVSLSKFVEDSAEELEKKVLQMESEFLDNYVYDYLAEFDSIDGVLTNEAANLNRINGTHSIFDKAFDGFLASFLVWFGARILEGAHKGIAHFQDIGINVKFSEVSFIEKQVGLVKGKIVKGSYLWNLGQMSEVRMKFQEHVLHAIQTGQRTNLFLRNIKTLIKSTPETRSLFSKYYMKYAGDAVGQTLNTVSLIIADKNGLDKFLYEGSLVKDSRPFCIAHAGNTYTRADAKHFDLMEWKGKNNELPFLIAAGGYQCGHIIKWLKK